MGKSQKGVVKFHKSSHLQSEKMYGMPENIFSEEKVKIISREQYFPKKIKINRGRPITKALLSQNQKKDQVTLLKYNEVDLIKNHFIKFLDSVGFRQGLVFTDKQRKRLKQQQLQNENVVPKIKWDNQHTWNRQQQMIKIVQITKKQKIFELIHGPNNQIYGHLLDIGDIFPRQITSQIYRFLCQMFFLAFKFLVSNSQSSRGSQQQSLKIFTKNILNYQNGLADFVFLTGVLYIEVKHLVVKIMPQCPEIYQKAYQSMIIRSQFLFLSNFIYKVIYQIYIYLRGHANTKPQFFSDYYLDKHLSQIINSRMYIPHHIETKNRIQQQQLTVRQQIGLRYGENTQTLTFSVTHMSDFIIKTSQTELIKATIHTYWKQNNVYISSQYRQGQNMRVLIYQDNYRILHDMKFYITYGFKFQAQKGKVYTVRFIDEGRINKLIAMQMSKSTSILDDRASKQHLDMFSNRIVNVANELKVLSGISQFAMVLHQKSSSSMNHSICIYMSYLIGEAALVFLIVALQIKVLMKMLKADTVI